MNKKFKNLMFLLAAALVVGGALTALMLFPNETGINENLPSEPEEIALIEKNIEEISKVSVKNKNDSFVVTREGDFDEDIIFNMPYKIDKLKDIKLRDNSIHGLLELVCNLKVTEKLDKNEDIDDEEFGFDKPFSTITATFDDKSKFTLIIGGLNISKNNHYISVSTDDDYIYLLPDFVAKFGTNGLEEFVDRILVDYEYFDGEDENELNMEYIEIKDYQDNIISRFDKNTERNDTAQDDILANKAFFKLTKPFETLLKEEKISELIGKVIGLEADSVIKIKPNRSDIIKHGLDKPDSVEIKVDKTIIRFKIGKSFVISEGDGDDAVNKLYYAVQNDKSSVIFAAAAENFVFGDFDPSEYLSGFLLLRHIEDMKTLEIKTADKTYTIQIGKTDEYNNFPVKVNDKTVDIEKFKTFYQKSLLDIIPERIYKDALPSKPDLVITYEYKDTDQPKDIINFYRLENRKMAMELNKTSTFMGAEPRLDRLIKHIELLSENKDYE